MTQPGEEASFAFEPFGECRIAGQRFREEFERDESIELWLPRLINETHAALANEFDDFKMRKCRPYGIDRGRYAALPRFGARNGRRCGFGQQTFRAKSLRGRIRNSGAAPGTKSGRVAHTAFP